MWMAVSSRVIPPLISALPVIAEVSLVFPQNVYFGVCMEGLYIHPLYKCQAPHPHSPLWHILTATRPPPGTPIGRETHPHSPVLHGGTATRLPLTFFTPQGSA